VTPHITASNKVYDGTTTATILTRTLTGVIGADAVSLTGGTATFADPNTGTGKTVTATGLGLSGSAATNYALSATTATALADITSSTGTGTSTLAVSISAPQYSDQETFTLTVTSSIPGQPAAGVNFFVGSQQVGNPAPVTVPLVAVGDPATATTYQAVWTGQLLDPTPFGSTPTGQMKPGVRIVTAKFVNPNFTMSAPTGKSINIVREDARIAALAQTSYSLGGAVTGVVPLTVTVKDITAMVGDAAYDAYGGDIRNAQVQFIDRATNAVIGTATVDALIGSGTTTGTATVNWSVNLGTAASKTYTIGFAVANYYNRTSTADNIVVTVSK
jgi:hypothetical protein